MKQFWKVLLNMTFSPLLYDYKCNDSFIHCLKWTFESKQNCSVKSCELFRQNLNAFKIKFYRSIHLVLPLNKCIKMSKQHLYLNLSTVLGTIDEVFWFWKHINTLFIISFGMFIRLIYFILDTQTCSLFLFLITILLYSFTIYLSKYQDYIYLLCYFVQKYFSDTTKTWHRLNQSTSLLILTIVFIENNR